MQPADPETHNAYFVEPKFPQPARTFTDSSSSWAIMMEAACQDMEAVVGPLLEGALMELFGREWESELAKVRCRLPPFRACNCLSIILRMQALQEKLPITIRKRVQAAETAVAMLQDSPGALGPDDVLVGQQAMRGVLQDCVKALKLPSLMGAGSKQFAAFGAALLPHVESAVLYFDMLVADCTAAAAAAGHKLAAA